MVFTLATAGQNVYLSLLNLRALKIAPLLAQYLYSHKRLDLPGLGTFLLDPSSSVEPETGKQHKASNLEGVSFENKPLLKETAELVQYISSQTGKIKALAAADLESHLGLAQQFLNIGKPFLFEGIGSLVKIRSGEFSFSSGQAIYVSPAAQPAKDSSSSAASEESLHDYKSVFYPRKTKTEWKKPVAILLLIGGLGLAIWGGYTVYKRTVSKNSNSDIATEEPKKDETILVQDTTSNQPSVANTMQTAAATTPAGNIKFVLEMASAKRAFARFAKLKNLQWPVQMETSDSLTYKLFLVIPGTASDTTRQVDSLRALNGKKVYVEL